MVKSDNQTPRADPKARAAFRLAAQYTMRSVGMLTQLTNGELMPALLSLAIVQANVAHLSAGASDGGFDGIDQIPPDAMRRPVSILALSTGIGVPYETTRRQVSKMIAAGQCKRVKGGVIVPTEVLDTPLHDELLREHLLVLRRLVRNLRAAGVIDD
jgi:hypothetical protein